MDLVTIAMFPNSIEATLAKNRLEEEGIDAVLADDSMGDLFHLDAVFAEVKVQVKADDAEKARAILDAVHSSPSSTEPEDAE